MRIFISGIAGFLGSHLAERLLAMGHDVVGCDSLLGGELVNVPPEAEFYQYDCRDFNAMAKVMRGCELVYHCAATVRGIPPPSEALGVCAGDDHGQHRHRFGGGVLRRDSNT